MKSFNLLHTEWTQEIVLQSLSNLFRMGQKTLSYIGPSFMEIYMQTHLKKRLI